MREKETREMFLKKKPNNMTSRKVSYQKEL